MNRGAYLKSRDNSGENNYFFGRKHTEGTRRIISILQGGDGVMRKCAVCEKEIGFIKPTRIKSGRGKFCSKICMYVGRKNLKHEDHPMWKGSLAGYRAIHHWIRRLLGAPQHCDLCGKSGTARYEWANIGHTYRRVASDWVRMCVRCHRRHDRGLVKIVQ